MAAKRRNGSTDNGQVLSREDLKAEPYWELDTKMTEILDSMGYEYDIVSYPMEDMPQVTPYSVSGGSLADKTSGQGNQTQVRLGTNESVVDGYASAFSRGEKLPTTTWDRKLNGIDAHHRALAAQRVGLSHMIIIRLRDALEPTDREIIATRRNRQHGQRMNDAETLAVALKAVTQRNWTLEDASNSFGISETSLKRAKADKETGERAESLGVEADYAKMKKGVRSEIADLHDEPFRALLKVFSLSGVPAGKAVEYIKEVKAQPSDKKAMETIKRIKDVDLAPATAQRGNTARAGITTGAMSVIDANKMLMAGYSPFKALMRNQRVVDALLTCQPTDPKFAKIHDVLASIKPNFDRLCKHFGVASAGQKAAETKRQQKADDVLPGQLQLV